jgi:tetratricopeptide (TPR) repeat protein
LCACILTPVIAQTTPATHSDLDAALLYQLLIGEMNAVRGEPGAAYSLMLDAARKTKNPQLFQRAVEIALGARAGESALQAARGWRQALPDSREANRHVLQILLGMNRILETSEPLKREIALTPQDERSIFIALVPRLYARAADRKLALQAVESALTEWLPKPQTGVASWTALGRMRLQAENLKGAFDAAQQGHGLDPQAVGPVLLALGLMGQGQTQAEVLVKSYLTRQSNPEVRLEYAKALVSNQRFAEALSQTQALTNAQPELADAWLLQGSLELQNNHFTAAEPALLRYLELAAARAAASAYLALAQIAEQRNDLTQAEAWLAKIGDPNEVLRVQIRRAGLMAKQGRLDEARQLIHGLPERNEDDARLKLAGELQLLRSAKKYAQAYALLNQALKSAPRDVEWLYEQAMLAEKMGNLAAMERLLRQVIAIKPDYHHAYNALGYSLADRNERLQEAKQLISKALEFAPGDPFISDSLAWVEFRLGNKQEALRLLEAAYKKHPDAEIAAHLGEVLWSLDRRDEAQLVWREGLALSADNETLLNTLKRLGVSR